jgi:hypothetical protein
MSAWLKRFGLHLAAAIGATGVFLAAAAVGASQARQLEEVGSSPPPIVSPLGTRTPTASRGPDVAVATPTPADASTEASTPAAAAPATPRATPRGPGPGRAGTPATPGNQRGAPERSLAGTIREVQPDGLDVVGVGGREWHVVPAPGALIRLNGRAARFDALQAGEGVVILGQAQPGAGLRFLAHAITARMK